MNACTSQPELDAIAESLTCVRRESRLLRDAIEAGVHDAETVIDRLSAIDRQTVEINERLKNLRDCPPLASHPSAM